MIAQTSNKKSRRDELILHDHAINCVQKKRITTHTKKCARENVKINCKINKSSKSFEKTLYKNEKHIRRANCKRHELFFCISKLFQNIFVSNFYWSHHEFVNCKHKYFKYDHEIYWEMIDRSFYSRFNFSSSSIINNSCLACLSTFIWLFIHCRFFAF